MRNNQFEARTTSRHGLPFNRLPLGDFFNLYGIEEVNRCIDRYAAKLDCTFEMADQIMTGNGVPAAQAIKTVLKDEGWCLLPTHKKMIIAKLEAPMKNVDYKLGQIVAAGVLAGAYPKSHKWDADRCLTHAARVTDEWPEPLCTKVARQMSVSDDSTQFNLKPVDCPACLAKLRKLGLPVPGLLPACAHGVRLGEPCEACRI